MDSVLIVNVFYLTTRLLRSPIQVLDSKMMPSDFLNRILPKDQVQFRETYWTEGVDISWILVYWSILF